MSDRIVTDAETEGATNSADRIHVHEYKRRDYLVFAVYYHGRCWKRLRPIRGEGPALWFEQYADGTSCQVSERKTDWLDRIRTRSNRYPRINRYPRRDLVGERLLAKLEEAHMTGQTEVANALLDQIKRHIGSSVGLEEVPTSNLNWNVLPRFDPTLVKKTRWLINSFVAENSVQLVFGERGSFKTTLFLCAGKAVAGREEFLEMKTRRRRVLYLDYENPANIIKARNDDLGLNLPSNPNLVIWDRFGNHPLPKPDDPALEEFVKDCIKETGHGPWVIFDSWSSLLRPGEGGENTGQIAPIYARFRKLSDLGATITVMDHSRKYDVHTIYGGQDKEAKVDTIHNLQTFENRLRPENAIVRVESWLKRFAPKGTGIFAFEVQNVQDDHGQWHVSGLKPVKDPVEAQKREKREFLRDLIRQNPDLGQEGLAKLAAKKGLARDQAIEILKLGTGKYWEMNKSAHGKYSYQVLSKT